MRTERAPSPSDPRDKGTDERTRTKDTTLTRGGTGSGDYRLRDYNRLEGSEANDFPRAGDNGDGRAQRERRKGGRAVEGDRKGGVAVIGSKEDTY